MEKKFEVDAQTFIGGWYMSEEICDQILDLYNNNKSLHEPGVVGTDIINEDGKVTSRPHIDAEAKKCTQLRVLKNAQQLSLYNIHLQAILDSYKQKYVTPDDALNYCMYFEAKTFLHGLFVVEDKLSMAHGLETRVPFMDNDLVEFAMNCPVGLKINNLANVIELNESELQKKSEYFIRTNDGKQILRDAMSTFIPNDVVKREKQGFSSPDASWFRGESIDFVNGILNNENSLLYEFLDPSIVKKLFREHSSGKKNRRLLVWAFLNVEEYLKQSILSK